MSAPTDPAAFVREFGRRAYRRALTQAEVDSYVTLFNQAPEMFEDGDAYSRGVELVLRAFLQSPHFLYRVESSTVAEGERVWLSNDEIATRLSYSLWNTMPSEELFAAADRGELSTAEGVRTWTSTMLGDPRAEDTIVSFHEQLFHIDGYGSIVKNATLFPTFTTELAPTLQEEARLFIRDVAVGLDGDIQSLLTEPVTYVNQSTAPFYGLAGTFGPEMQRVDLDPTRRAGILTQLGFLSRYGSQTQSDPILRGVHISLDFMCAELAPPPNGVPPLPPLADGQTNRERVEQSTSVAPCSGCHETYINPLGFAFENYDAIGQWRDTDNGLPVNAADTYVLDGAEVSYNNAVELSALLGQSETIHDCYSSRVLEYVLGRAPSVEEQNSVARLATVSLDSDSLRTLLAEVTTLDTFRARPPDSL